VLVPMFPLEDKRKKKSQGYSVSENQSRGQLKPYDVDDILWRQQYLKDGYGKHAGKKVWLRATLNPQLFAGIQSILRGRDKPGYTIRSENLIKARKSLSIIEQYCEFQQITPYRLNVLFKYVPDVFTMEEIVNFLRAWGIYVKDEISAKAELEVKSVIDVSDGAEKKREELEKNESRR
jgi:hypothetical protein